MLEVVTADASVEPVVVRIERLAIDCGELAVELHVFALGELERETGMTRAQMVERIMSVDPTTVKNLRDRERLESIQAVGDPGLPFTLPEPQGDCNT